MTEEVNPDACEGTVPSVRYATRRRRRHGDPHERRLEPSDEGRRHEPPPPAPEPGARFAPGDELAPGLYAWACLGDGRRCETWLAWSRPHWCQAVVKLPRAELAHDPVVGERLAEEAARLAGLAHPAIQRLLRDGTRDLLSHLVLEYAEGPTLGMLLEDEGPMAPGDVCRLGMQLAAALHYLHGRGLAHLDLKPGNVVLADGRAVIIDLDVARPLGFPLGGAHGTAAYMAPEQCRPSSAACAMDLFALGAVLFEAASGRRAFDPELDGSRWRHPQADGRAPISALGAAGVPDALAGVIARLLEPEPSRRPPLAADALRELAGALPGGEEGLWPEWAGRLLPVGR